MMEAVVKVKGVVTTISIMGSNTYPLLTEWSSEHEDGYIVLSDSKHVKYLSEHMVSEVKRFK